MVRPQGLSNGVWWRGVQWEDNKAGSGPGATMPSTSTCWPRRDGGRRNCSPGRASFSDGFALISFMQLASLSKALWFITSAHAVVCYETTPTLLHVPSHRTTVLGKIVHGRP